MEKSKFRVMFYKNKGSKYYVARCLDFGAISQGKTLREAQKNIKEAIEGYLQEFPEVLREVKLRQSKIKLLEVPYETSKNFRNRTS